MMKPRMMDIFLASITLLFLTGMTTYVNLSEPNRKGIIRNVTRFVRYLYEDMTDTSHRDDWD